MKIEKINDNQIRCTLTNADLAERHLRLSELAYGSEKAKSLFHDMMQQAAYQFGFEADNIPLMIEAIPASNDSVVLIITKVENPDELDTRFSKFAPSPSGDGNGNDYEALDKLEGAETLLDMLGKLKEKIDTSNTKAPSTPVKEESEEVSYDFRLFSFSNLDHVILAAKQLGTLYKGENALFKDVEEDVYILVMSKSAHSEIEFNRICNMMSEYGTLEKASNTTLAFLHEHCESILAEDAIQQLVMIS